MSDAAPAGSAPARRGRARSATAHDAILAAAADLVGRVGYDHVTMEGIAAQAGVGKQTIYRWWPSKGALIAECLLEGVLMPESFEPADTGDLEADLADWLGDVFAFLAVPEHAALVLSLVGASVDNSEVGLQLLARLGVTPMLLKDRMERALSAGQLPSATTVEAVTDALLGVVVLRTMKGEPFEREHGRQIALALVGPLVGAARG